MTTTKKTTTTARPAARGRGAGPALHAPRERVIRRYGNRKLYDPAARRYVTLEDLARMIGEGHEVKVVEQGTGEDITAVVFAQVILEGLKERTASIPQQVLSRIIRLAALPTTTAWTDWRVPHDAAARARQEGERIVAGLLSRGRLTLDEALALRQEIAGSVQRLAAEAQSGVEKRLRGLVERSAREIGASPALQTLRQRLLSFESFLPAGKPAAARAPRKKARSRKS